MTYATWIGQMRAQSGDTKRRVHVEWTGNGSDTVFQMPDDTFPILDDSTTYTIKVNSVTQTETTDFTLDKVSGTVTLIVASPNSEVVEIDSIAVYLLDADWLQIMNDVIKSLGDDFFKEFVDTAHKAVVNMLSISLVSLQANAIAVYEFSRRISTDNEWTSVEESANWRYDRDNNIIYIGIRTAFELKDELLRIRGLKKYTLGTATTDTLDLQDQYQTILEYGCLARYWRWRYKSVVELVSKMSQEDSRTPLQELIMLSDRFDRLYELEKSKLKPGKPARIIPPYKEGGGRP